MSSENNKENTKSLEVQIGDIIVDNSNYVLFIVTKIKRHEINLFCLKCSNCTCLHQKLFRYNYLSNYDELLYNKREKIWIPKTTFYTGKPVMVKGRINKRYKKFK